MNQEEKNCKDMADVCELADKLTILECNRKGIQVEYTSDNGDIYYTIDAQEIFNRYYDNVIEVTGL